MMIVAMMGMASAAPDVGRETAEPAQGRAQWVSQAHQTPGPEVGAFGKKSALHWSFCAESVWPIRPARREQTTSGAWSPYVGYSWSLSGSEYLEPRFLMESWGGFSMDLVTGLRLDDNVPSPGVGFGYRYEREKWAVMGGLAVLFPQGGQPDLTIGLSFAIRAQVPDTWLSG